MSLVEIVALWDPATFHFHDLHGPHDGLDRVLVVEDLIEFAPAALIVVGAELEFSLLSPTCWRHGLWDGGSVFMA